MLNVYKLFKLFKKNILKFASRRVIVNLIIQWEFQVSTIISHWIYERKKMKFDFVENRFSVNFIVFSSVTSVQHII